MKVKRAYRKVLQETRKLGSPSAAHGGAGSGAKSRVQRLTVGAAGEKGL